MTQPAIPGDGDSHYTDDDAKNILRRAVEIEKEGHVSAARLREIADEAQISPEAMNRALAEAAAEKQLTLGQNAQHGRPLPEAPPSFPPTQLSKMGWALVMVIVVAA